MPGSVPEIVLQKANEIYKSLVTKIFNIVLHHQRLIFKDQGYHVKDFAKLKIKFETLVR